MTDICGAGALRASSNVGNRPRARGAPARWCIPKILVSLASPSLGIVRSRAPHSSGHPQGVADYVGVAGWVSAETSRVRGDAHPAKIEPIGVPAGQHGHVACGVPIAVKAHGFAESLEACVVQLGEYAVAAQPHRKVRRTGPMLRVVVVVAALAVVQKSEPRQHRRIEVEPTGQLASVAPHATPVRQAVDATFVVKPELRPHDRERLANDGCAADVHG